jgi:pyruvate/2-oxoglutarate dehydrogenase complex dihydrolipoamide acyltransferase (E2) component
MLLLVVFLFGNYPLDRFDVTGIIHSFYPFINNRSKSAIHKFPEMDGALFTKEEKNNQIISG